MRKPVKICYYVLLSMVCLIYSNVMASSGFSVINKSKVTISKGTFLVLKNTNLNAYASIGGEGVLVLTKSSEYKPATISRYSLLSTKINNGNAGSAKLSVANGSCIQNLTLRTGTYVLENTLIVNGIFQINGSAELQLSLYNLFVNDIKGKGSIVENGLGTLIYMGSLSNSNKTINTTTKSNTFCPVNYFEMMHTRKVNGISDEVFTQYKSVITEKGTPPPKLTYC